MFVTLSKCAEHSVLWLVLAAGAALFGGRRGRCAAERGVLAIGGASAMANGLKFLAGRRRPVPRWHIYRMPRTPSFPSGHSASAFAFAVAASRELPEAAPIVLALAASVAYSRVYLGVHYPTDVLAGGAIGTVAGIAARPVAERLGIGGCDTQRTSPVRHALPEAVLVVSPNAGRSRGLDCARREIDRQGIEISAELSIDSIDRLPELLRTAAGEPRLVIAAGGDGTVGSVASRLAGTDSVLGVLPLGTGNDFARALGIPLRPRPAAELLATGEVQDVDLGRFTSPSRAPLYFAHAATAGLNVNFSKLATQASVRARLGRLTYLVAAVYALRERPTFRCTLRHDGGAEDLTLSQLSVIVAPVIGGSLGLTLRSPSPADGRLDAVALGDVPPLRVLWAGMRVLMGNKRAVDGVRAMRVESLGVDCEQALALTLDGELAATLPGEFDTLPRAIRVITPRHGEITRTG